ncbi:MAG TPA: hypothetical protein ENN43_08850 [bacterium]|nr:hypothetical protein [bacterium]
MILSRAAAALFLFPVFSACLYGSTAAGMEFEFEYDIAARASGMTAVTTETGAGSGMEAWNYNYLGALFAMGELEIKASALKIFATDALFGDMEAGGAFSYKQYFYVPEAYVRLGRERTFAAAGLINLAFSEAGLFAVQDIFSAEKDFFYINAVNRTAREIDADMGMVPWAAGAGLLDSKLALTFAVLPAVWSRAAGPSGRAGSNTAYYSRAEIIAESAVLSLYNCYEEGEDEFIGAEYTGINYVISYAGGNSYYFEFRTGRVSTWPIDVISVFGAKTLRQEKTTLIWENRYSTAGGYETFVEDERWLAAGWKGIYAVHYAPKLENNTKVYAGMKLNPAKNFEAEFRYGYESRGNHRFDINLTLSNM